MNPQRIDFLGLPLDTGLTIQGICDLIRQKGRTHTVSYISPSSWAVATKHPNYLAAMRQMSIIRAGGEGVARACRWLTGQDCPRINFDMTSLADPFFKTVAAEGVPVMLVGGKPGVSAAVGDKLKDAYPGIKIAGLLDGYGDYGPKIDAIKASAPGAVVVAMGSPQQELFLLALDKANYQGLSISCGGFFDQYLMNTGYYPAWINEWNLRFAYRLFKEPRRLWRRYLIDYQVFVRKAMVALGNKYLATVFKRS